MQAAIAQQLAHSPHPYFDAEFLNSGESHLVVVCPLAQTRITMAMYTGPLNP